MLSQALRSVTRVFTARPRRSRSESFVTRSPSPRILRFASRPSRFVTGWRCCCQRLLFESGSAVGSDGFPAYGFVIAIVLSRRRVAIAVTIVLFHIVNRHEPERRWWPQILARRDHRRGFVIALQSPLSCPTVTLSAISRSDFRCRGGRFAPYTLSASSGGRLAPALCDGDSLLLLLGGGLSSLPVMAMFSPGFSTASSGFGECRNRPHGCPPRLRFGTGRGQHSLRRKGIRAAAARFRGWCRPKKTKRNPDATAI